MAERIKMGLVGCGGMSGAHMGGYRELWSKDVREFDIVAACDIDKGRAENRANEAHEFQGGTNLLSIRNLTRCLISIRI